MAIKIFLPATLSRLTSGQHSFEVNGNTVRECLHEFVRLVPMMKKVVFYDSGRLDPTIKVLVNGESVGEEDLVRELDEGDEIYIKLNRH